MADSLYLDEALTAFRKWLVERTTDDEREGVLSLYQDALDEHRDNALTDAGL